MPIQMTYNFLGSDIHTTVFGNLEDTVTIGSKATAKIWSTSEEFKKFATSMYPVNVVLACGKVNLAVAEVST